MYINRLGRQLASHNRNVSRNLCLSSVNNAKKVIVTNEKKSTTIEGVPVDTQRKDKLVNTKELNKECCPICALDLKIKYTDVLILSQYLDEENRIIPFNKSNLCGRKYFLVNSLIKQAQECNLLAKRKDHLKFGPWEDLNHYVDFPNRKRDQPMRIIKHYWQ